MNEKILRYYDDEVRKGKSILASEYRQETDGNVRRIIGPFPLVAHNWIDHSELSSDELSNAVQRQVDHYSAIGHSFRWKVHSHDQPAELPDELLRRGFVAWEPCALMILKVSDFTCEHPDGFDYLELDDPTQLPNTLRPVKEQVWMEGADEFIAALQSEMRDMGEHMRIHVAQRHGETVGCGLVRYTERMTFGGLFAGATVPTERGKGIYRGLVAARVEDARGCGAEYLYTEAGDMSRPILEKLGFQNVSTIVNYAFESIQDSTN